MLRKHAVVDRKTLLERAPVPIEFGDNPPAYNFLDKKIQLKGTPETTEPALMAHEIGHAIADKTRLGKLVHNRPARMLNGVTSMALPFLDKKFNLSMGQHAAISALGNAPTYLGEGLANYHGAKYMLEHGATGKELAQAALKLAPPQSTYGIPLALDMFGGFMRRRAKMGSFEGRDTAAYAAGKYAALQAGGVGMKGSYAGCGGGDQALRDLGISSKQASFLLKQ